MFVVDEELIDHEGDESDISEFACSSNSDISINCVFMQQGYSLQYTSLQHGEGGTSTKVSPVRKEESKGAFMLQ